MSIQIQTIFRETRATYQLHPLTEDAGMTREFSWVQLCEDVDNIKFFRGNEFVITTGLMNDHASWLKNFIERLVHCRASGLILNVGKYISEQEMTDDLLAYCAEKDFPVFAMPWRIRFADIMQDYCKRLLLAQQKELNFETLVRGIITSSRQREDYLQALTSGLYPHTAFQLKLFELSHDSVSEEKQVQTLEAWKRMLNRLRVQYLVFFQQGKLLLVLFRKNPDDDFSIPAELMEKLPKPLRPVACGESMVHTQYAGLTESYQQAEAALEVARLTENTVMAFDDIGVYSLFFALKNMKPLRKMYDELLVPILRYDEEHNSQLAPTLRYYLFHMNSIQETARAMYAHRNTVSYRINKLKELTGEDFDDAVVAFNYMLAYYAGDYFRMKEITD